MSKLQTLPSRRPYVPERRLALTEADAERQHQRGLYTTHRGVWTPIPVDHIARPTVYLSRDLWRQDAQGRVFRPGARMAPRRFTVQTRALAWLRDHVDERIPYWYYMATLGHDLHVGTWGDLLARHFHAGWANPFNPDLFDAPLDPDFVHDCDKPHCAIRDEGARMPWGFVEDLGWLCGAKVTDAFVSEEIDELVSATGTEYADFDFHEVGTSTQAENNNDTALVTSTGIARATGSPTDADPIYRNVGTITADTTESWEEHGLFNNSSGVALMDRSLTGGQSVNSSDQVQYTYELTKNPEA